MKQMKILEVLICHEWLNRFERLRGPFNHCDSNASIQGHDRTRLNNFKKVIEPENLMPICVLCTSRSAMHSDDCGLDSERSGSALRGMLDKR
jgi:hypothetical protein